MRLFFAFLLLAFSGCGTIAPKRVLDSEKLWKPEINYKVEKLSNGLTLLMIKDNSSPVISFSTWVRVGSAWEKKGETGIAHLFEHLMFKGTEKFGAKSFFEKLEGKGAEVNAYTERNVTVYYEVMAKALFEQAVDMESDRLRNLRVIAKDLDLERKVVLDERRQRVDSNFSAQHINRLYELVYGENQNHPYSWPPIGYQADLDRVTVERCNAFFTAYYQPKNVMLVVAGDLQFEETKNLIRKYYEDIPSQEVNPLVLPLVEKPKNEIRFILKKPVKQTSILVGYLIPSFYDKDTEALSMLAWSIFGMKSSKASRVLVREKQIAHSVGADAVSEPNPSLFLISLDLREGISIEKGLKELDRIIEDSKLKQIEAHELDRVKNALIYMMVNDAKTVHGYASHVANGLYYFNDPEKIFKKVDRLQSVTAQEIQDMAKKYLNPKSRYVVVLAPESP